ASAPRPVSLRSSSRQRNRTAPRAARDSSRLRRGIRRHASGSAERRREASQCLLNRAPRGAVVTGSRDEARPVVWGQGRSAPHVGAAPSLTPAAGPGGPGLVVTTARSSLREALLLGASRTETHPVEREKSPHQ